MIKKRDTSNRMVEIQDLAQYFKDKIIYPEMTIFIDGEKKYLYGKNDLIDRVTFICN